MSTAESLLNIADTPAMKEIYNDIDETRQKQEKIFDDISNELKNVAQELKESTLSSRRYH